MNDVSAWVCALGDCPTDFGLLLRHADALESLGATIPRGFVVAPEALEHLLSGLGEEFETLFSEADPDDPNDLMLRSFKLGRAVKKTHLPADLHQELEKAYLKLCQEEEITNVQVAVYPNHKSSFEGATRVRGLEDLEEAVRGCYSEHLTRRLMKPELPAEAPAVVVRRSRGAEVSGIALNFEPKSGHREIVAIYSNWGLAEDILRKELARDEFFLHKARGSLVRKHAGFKEFMLHYDASAHRLQHLPVNSEKQRRLSLQDEQVRALAECVLLLEKNFAAFLELEWTWHESELHLTGVRTLPAPKRQSVKFYTLQERSRVLAEGAAVGHGLAVGQVRIVSDHDSLAELLPGEVLVAESTRPDWEPGFRKASAIVTCSDTRTSHSTILAREMGRPALLGVQDCTQALATGQTVTVCCNEGERGRVYEGALKFSEEEYDLDRIPDVGTELLVSLSLPEQALGCAQQPWAGAGLVRSEFIFTGWVKIHPMALVGYKNLPKMTAETVARLTRGYPDKADYFLDKMTQAISLIASAFWPRPVTLRLSDLKSNEYSRLVGGQPFEPKEEVPALGWRGPARYLHKNYRDAFQLELEAIRRVRQDMGFTNLHLMIPFCRTPEEGSEVLDLLEQEGLTRGINGLQVWVMAELPSNVLQAREFASMFDGLSIGSNDLTQLMLGVDRNSKQVASLFDELHPAVMQAYDLIIEGAHQEGKPVRFCGQAASEDSEFAALLVEMGIDALSLATDALVPTLVRLRSNRS